MSFEESCADDSEKDILQAPPIRTKGKYKTYARQKEVFVQVKPKTRAGKCLGAGQIELPTPLVMESGKTELSCYNFISNDMWYHVSDHIPPEDVRTFALVCRQTADLVNTRKFWLHIYRRYCRQEDVWKQQLPEHLHLDTIRNLDTRSLRWRVVEALFHCYTPFVERVLCGYSLDMLLGNTYTASWHEFFHCVWIMCYKFSTGVAHCQNQLEAVIPDTGEVNDWESLAEDDQWCAQLPRPVRNPTPEGTNLLIICCESFIPFPTNLLYDCGESQVKLAATRQMLASDMRRLNLELDFADTLSNVTTTVFYPKILNWKVVPWWHPDFRKVVK